MKKTGITGLLCAFLLIVFSGAFAQTTDVYFVGNSFTSTYDVPAVFKALAASGGHTARTAVDIIGGSSLDQHWATGKATNDIANTNYHYVVLQEGSTVAYTASTEESFNTYAPLFHQAITNSGAQTMLYMTWVRESYLATGLTNGIAIYRNMAAQLGCKISPVGEAWRRVLQQYPALDLFSADRHHPNEKGTYLAACNFYGAIFNESPQGLSMRTVGGFTVDAIEAALLQRIAWDAVQFVSYTNPPVITGMTVDEAVKTNSVPFIFHASATDNGSITDYFWDFGDGTTTNGPALTDVSHDYATDGVFLVTVKVTDDSGETERFGLTVTRDTTGPQISSITAASQMLTVRFNQEIQQAGAETATNYTISGGLGATVLSATQVTSNVVRLEVSTLTPGVEYTLTVNNLYNALGMKIYPNTYKTFMYVDNSGMRLWFDFGGTNYLTEGNWNNVPYAGGDLVISNAIDVYGTERNIGLRRVPSAAVSYASVSSGSTASNLYPASAQRDCVYSTKAFSYQIEGADPAAEYRLIFFASKSAATRETLFTVGTSNVVLDTAYNTDRTAVFERVKSDSNGNILFTVDTNAVNSSGFCYLSVLDIQDTTAEIPRFIETDVSSLDIDEGTVSNILVRLSSQPASDVTVSVNASGYAHVQVLSESAFVHFSATNWNVWQPVYVEAIDDADADNGTATISFADTGEVYSSTNVSATQIDDEGIGTAGFTASPVSGWAPLDVTFTDTSTISGITNRYWDFGDGTTTNTSDANITHTYTSGGTNTVQLIVSSPVGMGTNTQSGLIRVAVPVMPAAGFTLTPSSGTAPLSVSFTDTSTGDITNRFWDFGDGATTSTMSTAVSHTYTAAGTHTVELTVSGPAGADTDSQADAVTVTLPPAPVAGFSATPLSGPAPLAVTFTDTSTGSITNRFWDFGDGKTTNITASSITHTYTSSGTNTVRLIVSGLGGADTNTQADLIGVSAAAAGELVLQETFSHPYEGAEGVLIGRMPDIGGIAWATNGTGTGIKTNVVEGSLSAPDGFPASAGNSARFGKIGTWTGKEAHARFTAQSGAGTTIYYSFLFRVDEIADGKGGSIAGLSFESGAEYVQLRVTNAVGSTGYMIDLGGRSTTAVPMRTNEYAVGTTHLIVMSYAFVEGTGNDVMNFWLDPDPSSFGGAAPAPTTTRLASTDTSITSGLNTLELKNGSTQPIGTIDEIRLGTSWAVVVPANTQDPDPESKYIEASTNALDITEGTTNSFQIRLSSQPSADVTVSISRISGDTEIQPVSSSAVFTPANWSDWQSVDIEALTDADTNNAAATIGITDAGSVYSATNVAVTQIDTTVIPPDGDADDDGIPDEWEERHFGGSTNANAHGMAANGMNTILEAYVAGLDPTNAQSVFAVSKQQLASQHVLQWNAVSGRVCSVYWTTNLLSGFQAVETNLVWPQNSWTDTVHGAQGGGYYRIKVRMGQ